MLPEETGLPRVGWILRDELGVGLCEGLEREHQLETASPSVCRAELQAFHVLMLEGS